MNKGESLMSNQVKSEVQIPLKTDLKINLDINPETFFEWEEKWLEKNPNAIEPKRYFDFYDDITHQIQEHFKLDGFKYHGYDTEEPLHYVNFDDRIEQYWKAENEDVIVWDFESNLFKHRYTITFSAKTLKGLYLISSYLLSILEEDWFMEINTDIVFKTKQP